MTPSLEGRPTKAKEAPSPHEVGLAPLDTNPVFHSLWDEDHLRILLEFFLLRYFWNVMTFELDQYIYVFTLSILVILDVNLWFPASM